jgi:hypothetical protein
VARLSGAVVRNLLCCDQQNTGINHDTRSRLRYVQLRDKYLGTHYVVNADKERYGELQATIENGYTRDPKLSSRVLEAEEFRNAVFSRKSSIVCIV